MDVQVAEVRVPERVRRVGRAGRRLAPPPSASPPVEQPSRANEKHGDGREDRGEAGA